MTAADQRSPNFIFTEWDEIPDEYRQERDRRRLVLVWSERGSSYVDWQGPPSKNGERRSCGMQDLSTGKKCGQPAPFMWIAIVKEVPLCNHHKHQVEQMFPGMFKIWMLEEYFAELEARARMMAGF